MASEERELGVQLFNATWELVRSRADDDRMLHMAHASRFHWGEAPECKPENLARGEWMVSRVYTVLGRAEPAIWHARRCLDHCEDNGIGDWDLAYAYEALAPAPTRSRATPRLPTGRRRRASRATRSPTRKTASTSTRTTRRFRMHHDARRSVVPARHHRGLRGRSPHAARAQQLGPRQLRSQRPRLTLP